MPANNQPRLFSHDVRYGQPFELEAVEVIWIITSFDFGRMRHWDLYAHFQTYYGKVMSAHVSIRPGLRVSISCPSVRLSVTDFRIFFQNALIFWSEILHMTLFYCTTNQAIIQSICVNCCRSYAYFGTKNTGYTHLITFFFYMFRHIELKFCFTVPQIKLEYRRFASIFVGVMSFYEPRILEKHICISTLLSFMLWLVEPTFCIWLPLYELQIKYFWQLLSFWNFGTFYLIT